MEGWLLVISYKFTHGRDRKKYYQVSYSNPKLKGQGIALLTGSSPASAGDSVLLRALPASYFSFRTSIPLLADNGRIGIFIRKNGYPKVVPGRKIHVSVMEVAPPEKGHNSTFGYVCSNTITTAMLPK